MYSYPTARALAKELIFTIDRGDAIHFDHISNRITMSDSEASLRRQIRARFDSQEEFDEYGVRTIEVQGVV